MSRKAGLAKKIAHTLMAMSIVYSSGINIVVNEVYAAEKILLENEEIKHGGEFTKSGTPGNDFSASGGITDGEDLSYTGVIKTSDLSGQLISIKATGGKGGEDNADYPTVKQGAKGGDAIAKVTIDGTLSSVTTGDIAVSAYAGANGSAYQGTSAVSGAAAAYGLELKHDLTITAADITVKAGMTYHTPGIGGRTDIAGDKHSEAMAVGLKVDSGTVDFTAGKIKVIADSEVYNLNVDVIATERTKLSDGGDAAAYGIQVNGGEVSAKLTGDIVFDKVLGADGSGTRTEVSTGKGVDGGNGGNAYAYGVDVNGGIAHLDLQNITIDNVTYSGNYINGGVGGIGAGTGNSAAAAGKTGNTGKITAFGVNAEGGRTDGNIKTIKIELTNKNGNDSSDVVNRISGNGGAGGAVYAAGISSTGGEVQLNVAEAIDIKATAGNGGKLNWLELESEGLLTATGAVQSAAGKGGEALAAGIDNRGGSSNVTAKDIKITAIGGSGGTSAYRLENVSEADAAILAAERVSGEGGEATAIGLQNTDGSLTADVQKLEITATGGAGGAGLSTYSTISGAGADSGAAAAYGINVLGGLAENLTVAEITVQATGGTSQKPRSGFVNATGAGVTGGKGGKGGAAAAYGVSNSGGSAGVTVAKITISANGGTGGAGGGVDKSDGSSYVAAGTGGDGGDGGSANAYGVFGSGSSRTVIVADKISAEAVAGAGGAGATSSNDGYDSGVATAGSDGAAGKEAKAYGVYANQGAVIDLSAKSGDTIKIGAKAAAGSVTNEAYAVYADKGTVLFGSNAELNTSDGASTPDNNVLTSLNNATLGFSGTSADRKVTGGTLQLSGSNEFRVTTDLANNKSDRFTFAKLASGSSMEEQYITVGYDKAFDGSSADSISGSNVVVLSVADLNGQTLGNFVGKESIMDDPLSRFSATPTVVVDDTEIRISKIDLNKDIGPSDTMIISNDASLALRNVWRIEGNNVMKRMGELRSGTEAGKGGVWDRYYRGELSADSNYDSSFSQDYTGFQGGIDKVQDYKGGKLYTGIVVNRIDSNAGYTAGSGDLSSTGVGLYGSWLGSKGHYLDVIARGSKLTNDFKLVDLSGNAAKADYDTWAYGISAEYGYRQDLNAGWFVEPQAELSLGHISRVDYTTSNGVSIRQDGVNSAIVRLGFLGGKEFSIGGRPSNAYVKASLLHDFGGNGGSTGYYGIKSLAMQTGDLTGSWYEIGLGANLGIAKNSNLYFDALKTLNSTVRTDWQFNAGLRFTF
ncbi:autotransporter outer membrane beta-barrel domain-containing protein [Phascolarctobacterium faecium]|uniref:autotransporter outer membrane beta-barrel domain-containing protein n=1 Tax=Phascolarctobacterium faecium TaxID=33025 RepID=UPI001D9BEFB2|nr:autotransporter outer membrane beta-barrel domain-containing protein [Phascolarctobacterium faecium]MBS1316570.1 autotransporter outer membrane beta-barrel domain-containing protein [Acidaminococcaceae bacterium]MBS1331355.1 autotransporter outer membrane beta-barrel domain-containing protein [Acidaminococcaceae bacterium]